VRSPALRLALVLLAVAAVVLAALTLREPSQPYVITAIDYHFHDAHPTFPIAPGRDLVVKNAGSNVHNVTIPALDIVYDIAPGDEFIVEDIAGRLAPGRYELVCRLHRDRGMNGVIVIVDE
jgi:plastocyanin